MEATPEQFKEVIEELELENSYLKEESKTQIDITEPCTTTGSSSD
jgi:hypothetical protein